MLPGQIYTPEDLLRIAWQRKWLLLIPLVVFSTGTILYTRTLPNKYRSSTVISVVPQRIPENYVRPTVTTRIEDRLVTIRQQTLSRSRLEPIIKEFGLYKEQRDKLAMEDVVEIMRADIDPKVERGDAFSLTYINEDPVIAKKVVERLASLFINENLRERSTQVDTTNTFLDGALENAESSLRETEKQLEQYRLRNAGRLPSNVGDNLSVIQATQVQLQQIADSLERDQERRRGFERQITDVSNGADVLLPAASASAAVRPRDDAELQLEAATRRLNALEASGLTSEHPDVREAVRQIRDITRKLEARPRDNGGINAPETLPRPAESPRASQIRALRAEITLLDEQITRKETDVRRLGDQLAVYRSKVDAAPALESEVTALTRDYATKTAMYQDLLGKREASRLAGDLERQQQGEQFRVLDPPRAPERPFSPNRPRTNALGALAGLALGVGIIALLEYRDRSVKTADEVLRVLQLPVLALVPVMQSSREQLTIRRRQLFTTAGFVGVFGAAVSYLLWTFAR